MSTTKEDWTGRKFEVESGPVAHGGHFVARHEGRVLFVRHALPGERVVVSVYEDNGGSFCRADAVEILEPSPDRVEAPCPFSGPGMCGGCDFQHVSWDAQRDLKAEVVREQLSRLAKIERDVVVEALPGGPLEWRTRIRMAVGRDGKPGFRGLRSHDVDPDRPLCDLPAGHGRGGDRPKVAGAGAHDRPGRVTATVMWVEVRGRHTHATRRNRYGRRDRPPNEQWRASRRWLLAGPPGRRGHVRVRRGGVGRSQAGQRALGPLRRCGPLRVRARTSRSAKADACWSSSPSPVRWRTAAQPAGCPRWSGWRTRSSSP